MGALAPTFCVLAVTGLLGAVAGATEARPRPLDEVALAAAQKTSRFVGKISQEIVALAAKWAAARGLPLDWVLATIWIESGGDPTKRGDTRRQSWGLMQINTEAQAARLRAHGLKLTQLFDPDINIMIGTEIMREHFDKAQRVLGHRKPPVPLGLIVRLAYVRPASTFTALRRREDPRTSYNDAPLVAAKWSETLAQARALV
jgi:hypothetical protein